MKKRICILSSLLITALSATTQTNTTDDGVEINGVVWATRNVDIPGTFAPTPQDYGKLYQWNRAKAWDYSRTLPVPEWDRTYPLASETWDNNVCPTGWRVPTKEEFDKLLEAPYIFTNKENDYYYNPEDEFPYGYTFGIAPNTIFLPMGGGRDSFDGGVNFSQHRGSYWSSTMSTQSQAFLLELDVTNINHFAIVGTHYTPTAYSVRCVKKDTSTNLKNIGDEDVRIYAQNSSIIIENTIEIVQVYNISGQLVVQGTGTGAYSVPSTGVYVVKVGDNIRKLIVGN